MSDISILPIILLLFTSLTGATSSDEPIKTASVRKVTIVSQLSNPVKSPDPLFSGGSSKKGMIASSIRSHSTIDSLYLPCIENEGSEWNGRYIYFINQAPTSLDSASVIVFDIEDGSVVSEWKLPFSGYCMGIAFVKNAMYVSNWTDGEIKKVSPTTHSLLDAFGAPGSVYVRGITSDGKYLYIGVAGTVDSIFKTDTLINVLNSWDISSFCDSVMDLAYAGRDSTIWLTDDNTKEIIKVDITGPTAILLEAFTPPGNPSSNVPIGISFDGSDLWFNTYYGGKLYRIDGEYSRSRIALFQEHEPWGYRGIKDILYDSGIPFKEFGIYDIGSRDLSIYTKAIIASQQNREMFDSIATHRTWWENWITNGGVLEINGAVLSTENWEGLIMPGGFSYVHQDENVVNIVSPWYPIVNYPHKISDNSLNGWYHSTHGYLRDVTNHCTILVDNSDRPVLVLIRLGAGGIIATLQPLEWAWGHNYCPILENVIKYWQFGVRDNILFAIADDDQSWMRNALTTRYQEIGNIDYVDGRDYTPDVKGLMIYDVVLTYPYFIYQYQDRIAMGDTLAAYVDSGGKVVTAGFCWRTNFSLGGTIMTPGYNPFNSPSGNLHPFSYANLGWYDDSHAIMDGITSFSKKYRDSLELNPGADTVAKYEDGEYLIGYKTQPSGGVVIGFNAIPFDSALGWTGQMVRLTRNILHWSATSGIVEDEPQEQADIRILEVSGDILKDKGWLRFYLVRHGNINFRIFDVSGRVVYSKSIWYLTSGRKTKDFNVSNLTSGPYFLHLISGNKCITRKIIVIR